MRIVGTVARGLETVLARELESFGARSVETSPGAVRSEGELELAYRAVLHSRSASRVLLPLASFGAPTPDALYEGVRTVDWSEHLTPRSTLAVECVLAAGVSGHTRYLAQRTKDAICDQLRERTGARPSVDRERPDVRVHVYLGRGAASVSIDLRDAPLHRRGYRAGAGGEAPLRETLAAGLLLHARWDEAAARGEPLVDPMCGSATFLIEAALIAADIAPALGRGVTGRPPASGRGVTGRPPASGGGASGMARWGGHDAALWQWLVREASERAATGRERALPKICGFDAGEAALRGARAAVERAGMSDAIELSRMPLAQVAPPADAPAGLLVVNPPYGKRLGNESELVPLYAELGDVLKRRFGGYVAWVLCGSGPLAKHIGLRTDSRLEVYNGSIACRFLEYPLQAPRVPAKGEGEPPERGPGWRRPGVDAAPFANRLRKNVKHRRRWARREGIECYRVYDADVPEYNFAVDIYGGHAVVQEYAAPSSVDPALALRRVRDALLVVAAELELPREAVVLKVRRRQTQGAQYEASEPGELREVREGACTFLCDLHGHLDTGLFPDHRKLRALVAHSARGGSMLNLYAYTCTASVAAARAGATTTSVDLSSNYLAWGEKNFEHNALDPALHRFVKDDCTRYLESARERFAVILCNPPVYSRSHRMQGDFDVRRDHPQLIDKAMERLAPGGTLFFATHAREFELDAGLARRHRVQEISAQTVPDDFKKSPHSAFRITAGQ